MKRRDICTGSGTTAKTSRAVCIPAEHVLKLESSMTVEMNSQIAFPKHTGVGWLAEVVTDWVSWDHVTGDANKC